MDERTRKNLEWNQKEEKAQRKGVVGGADHPADLRFPPHLLALCVCRQRHLSAKSAKRVEGKSTRCEIRITLGSNRGLLFWHKKGQLKAVIQTPCSGSAIIQTSGRQHSQGSCKVNETTVLFLQCIPPVYQPCCYKTQGHKAKNSEHLCNCDLLACAMLFLQELKCVW